jgi:hypothetical protein
MTYSSTSITAELRESTISSIDWTSVNFALSVLECSGLAGCRSVSIRALDLLYLRDREAWEMESVQTEKDGHSVRSEERTLAGLSNA